MDRKLEIKNQMFGVELGCICLTCGIRNDFSHPSGLCQNDHDDWLEERDFMPEGIWEQSGVIERAMKLTGMSRIQLENRFSDPTVKQFELKK